LRDTAAERPVFPFHLDEVDEDVLPPETDRGVRAGGPVNFNGISAYQNQFVESVIKDLTSTLDSIASDAIEQLFCFFFCIISVVEWVATAPSLCEILSIFQRVFQPFFVLLITRRKPAIKLKSAVRFKSEIAVEKADSGRTRIVCLP